MPETPARRTVPPARYPETLSVLVAAGTGDRLHRAAELAGDRGRAETVRRALDRELARIERAAERRAAKAAETDR